MSENTVDVPSLEEARNEAAQLASVLHQLANVSEGQLLAASQVFGMLHEIRPSEDYDAGRVLALQVAAELVGKGAPGVMGFLTGLELSSERIIQGMATFEKITDAAGGDDDKMISLADEFMSHK